MSLDSPQIVMARLAEIDEALAVKQNIVEAAALDWYRAKRDKEHRRAVVFISTEGSVAQRNAVAERETALDGRNEEALYESLRAALRVLETRASIGQSILKAQSR